MRNVVTIAAPLLLACASGACAEPARAAAPPSVRPEPRITATPVAAAQAVNAPAVDPPPARHFGQPIEANAAAVRLADLLATPQRFEGQAVRVVGEVVAVCQMRGCWMEIRDAATQAHIRMHGHSFFVPRDLRGHRAAVEATLVAAHPATECDDEARAATGRVAQLELDATGVDVID
jgi:hypothetical protein